MKTLSQRDDMLREYREKRKFDETPEPESGGKGDNIFVVQKHKAERAGLHYDLRLQEGNVLRSWAVRKGMPKGKDRHLAVEQPMHPLCLHPSTIVEGRSITKLQCGDEVLSANVDYGLELKLVTGVYRTQIINPVTLYYHVGRSLKKLLCSTEHVIYTPRGITQAGRLHKGDTVYHISNKLPKDILSMVLGMILGDAYLVYSKFSNTAEIRFSHSESQKDYFDEKIKVLLPFLRFYVREEAPTTKMIYGKEARFKRSYNAHSNRTTSLHEVRLMAYRDNRKTITNEWLQHITPASLAFWYLDGGNCNYERRKSGGRRTINLALATLGFPLEEVKMLQEMLRVRFKVSSIIYRGTKYKNANHNWGYYLRIVGSNIVRFLELISPYVPSSMLYKLGVEHNLCYKCKKGYITYNKKTVCPNCLLDDLKSLGYPSDNQHDSLDSQGLTTACTSTYANQFGSYTHACSLARDGVILDTVPTYIKEVGSLLNSLSREYQRGIVPIELFAVSQCWNPPRDSAYDITVADNHNYFANGVLVSNSYANFEGTIPKGLYGAGSVTIDSKSTYTTIKKDKDTWKFKVESGEYKGSYTLHRLEGKKWLIMCGKD